MSGLLREPDSMLVTIGTTPGASTEIPVHRFAGGSFQLPTSSGTTQVTLYAKLGNNDYDVAQDEDGATWVKAVVAGRPRQLPSMMHAFPLIKLVASAGAATENVPVFAKS